MQSSLVPIYEKVGGWLILVAIGLVSTIALGVYLLATTHFPLFVNGSLGILLNAPPGTISPYLLPVFFAEIGGNSFFIVFAGVLLAQLKTRNPIFPRNAIVFYASNLAFVVLDLLAYQIIMPGQALEKSDYQTLGRTIVGCTIWIPYFLVSRRVKGTFRTQPSFEAGIESETSGTDLNENKPE